ncbi:Mini-ribonuclease 3 [Caldicoprobacter algeriensis]|uniref:Mini-ribonuclease 3 n=1 Tax=Caldicoprobacter algeriensis TaxID=699281 RepID=UPI002079B690|nr:ribonuclease III domain-containing protein [Caldicoprobacter algeriensis]MCM8900407.1 Mini-ribonuclease 3 [Caldicoprobacter algeriensis]
MRELIERLEKRLNKKFDELDVRRVHPLVLAYIGDTIYDLFVRTYLVMAYNVPVHQLHVKAIDFVRAKGQADTLRHIEEFLTQEELDIVRRGRNAKPGTMPKNATVADYRLATGFESLLGYLYLMGRDERLLEILDYILDNAKEGEKGERS